MTHRRPGADGDLLRAFGFAEMLWREEPDALLLSALKRVFWAGWAGRRAGVPRIVERIGIEHDFPDQWKYRHAFRHYVDAVVVNSSAIRDRWLATAPPYAAEDVHVVLNGVRHIEPGTPSVRNELGLPDGAPLVVGAGRLERRKGFDILLAALRHSPTDAHLAIAGDGVDGPALRSLARELGVQDRVHWLGFRAELASVLLAADVFVLPSRKEGMANVMLEAMAAGCLLVATDVSGTREALGAREGRAPAGWIVPTEDAPAMGAALSRAVRASRERAGSAAREGRAAAMKREARWRVENWFSPERTVEETEAVLAGGRSGPLSPRPRP